jgi:hypothetical protein
MLRVNYRTSHQIRTQADRLLGPTGSQGVAMMLLADRKKDTAMAKTAFSQIHAQRISVL